MSPSRVTVFGGTGFIGRPLVERLVQGGATPRVAARHRGGGRRRRSGEAEAVETVRADILDREAVRSAVSGADAVVNLVGIMTEGGRQTYSAVHVTGARNVAEVAAEAGVPILVHVSALAASSGSPAVSDRTKAAGEAAVREAFPQATIARPSLVYGPDDHFITRFEALARRAPAIPLIGGGRTLFQPLFVEDAAAALMHLATDPGTRGRAYALVGPDRFSFRQLIEFIFQQLGRTPRILSLPFPAAEALAAGLELLPDPPLTRDQVRLMHTDKVAAAGALTPADLGIAAARLEDLLPSLVKGGRRRRS